MTIYATFLSRGYFPKELPPAFSSEDFSRFARTAAGRALIASYKPPDGLTDCVAYRLALPGADGLTTRPLSIPHPSAYARLAAVVSKNFRRLLKKAGASPFSKSAPVYAADQQRALSPTCRPDEPDSPDRTDSLPTSPALFQITQVRVMAVQVGATLGFRVIRRVGSLHGSTTRRAWSSGVGWTFDGNSVS